MLLIYVCWKKERERESLCKSGLFALSGNERGNCEQYIGRVQTPRLSLYSEH